MLDTSSETATKGIRAVVIGTHHEFQRHQDTSADSERVRADFEKLLRSIIEERKITLVAEEASDDKAVWESLKKDEESAAGLRGLFGDFRVVDGPVPTIANKLANEYGTKYADVDVDVRTHEGNAETVAKRDAAITHKILSVLGDAERVLIIVGEHHRAGVWGWLKNAGWAIESFHFPRA